MNLKWRLYIIAALCITSAVSCGKKNTGIVLAPSGDLTRDTIAALIPGDEYYDLRAVNVPVNQNTGGLYAALPPLYENSDKKYPLLVFLHGGGDFGNGNQDLFRVLSTATPRLLKEKAFPVNFNVNGENFSFIVVIPQFKVWPKPEDVESVIQYASANYRVDADRIYMSGLSMGGGATWQYAAKYGEKLAAMVPICGGSWADSTSARQIAANNIPLWAFHNNDDSVVTVRSTTRYVEFIGSYHPVTPVMMTLWPTGGHDAWTKATDPDYREQSKNMYEWMLQFVRR